VVAEKLAGLVDKGSPRRVYLGNSGTEAVEAPSSWLGTSSGGGSSWRSWVPFTVESWVTGADREQERPEEGLSPLDFAAQTIEECLGLLN
jgi:hypothetical protein